MNSATTMPSAATRSGRPSASATPSMVLVPLMKLTNNSAAGSQPIASTQPASATRGRASQARWRGVRSALMRPRCRPDPRDHADRVLRPRRVRAFPCLAITRPFRNIRPATFGRTPIMHRRRILGAAAIAAPGPR